MLRGKSRLGNIALKCLNERWEDIEVLFLNRGEVGTNGAEGLRTGEGAEAAGDLVLDLGHANSLFREVVAEGNTRVGGEAQDIVGMIAQTPQEIERHALRRASAFASGGLCGVGDGAPDQDGVVGGANRLDAHRRQGLPLNGDRFMVGGDEQVDHAFGPRLHALFMDEGQFAQVMRVAQRMITLQFPSGKLLLGRNIS